MNDNEKVKSLMRLYRNTYRGIGCLIIVIGFVLVPIYPSLIAYTPNIPHLDLIFLLYVFNTGFSYFFSYKNTLLECDQKSYLRSIVHYLSVYVMNIFQVIILLATSNYILYLVCQLLFTVIQNIVISIVANWKYPYLKDKDVKTLEDKDKSLIRKNVGAIFLHKVGDRLTNSGLTIFISKYINLSITGVYSNYRMVADSVSMVIGQAFSAIIGSVGNLEATESPDKIYLIFSRVFFLNYFLVSICSVCILCLIQPFMVIWVGADYLLDSSIVIALVVNFYCTCMRRTVIVFRDASASYYYDRFKPFVELALTFMLAYFLVNAVGVLGVLLATIFCQLFFSTWVEAFVFHKYVLHKQISAYFCRYMVYAFLCIINCVICYMLSSNIPGDGLLCFLGKAGLTAIVAVLFVTITSAWIPEFKYWYSVAIGFIRKLKYGN